MRILLVACFGVAVLSLGAVVANADSPKPALGVTMSENGAGGALITSVIPNSPAARLGLMAGDRILAINGQPTPDHRDVTRIIGASRLNAPVELTVGRGVWQGKLTTELESSAIVFNPAQQPTFVVVPPMPQFVPASTSTYATPDVEQGPNGFPIDFLDNGSRGAAASYGAGGY
jgi:S1-C subfamily serine protease